MWISGVESAEDRGEARETGWDGGSITKIEEVSMWLERVNEGLKTAVVFYRPYDPLTTAKVGWMGDS